VRAAPAAHNVGRVGLAMVVAVRLLLAAQTPGGVVRGAAGAEGRAKVVGELSLGAELAEAVRRLAVHARRTGDAKALATAFPAGSTVPRKKVSNGTIRVSSCSAPSFRGRLRVRIRVRFPIRFLEQFS
jgi:hypothetical protein